MKYEARWIVLFIQLYYEVEIAYMYVLSDECRSMQGIYCKI